VRLLRAFAVQRFTAAWLAAAGLGPAGCASGPDATDRAASRAGSVAADPRSSTKGPSARSVLHREPAWRARYTRAAIRDDDIEALREAPAETEVVIVFGTWCPDSRRVVPVIWRAFHAAGALPFAVEHVEVDREKRSDRVDVAAYGLRYVPTIIVRRNGREVGRIVESAPHGVMSDFVDLLHGRARGVLTRRTDLGSRSSLTGADRKAGPPRRMAE